MEIQEFCTWLHDTPFARALRESTVLFPAVESVHVLAITLMVGSIIAVDLRLLGLASRERAATQIIREVLPITWAAFGIAALTGATMFTSDAVKYSQNLPFRMKMLLLALAGVNMLFFHLFTYRGIARWDASLHTPLGAKLAGGISIALWLGIVSFGRVIGFTTGL